MTARLVITLNAQERAALLYLLRGAQDDDEGDDADYTAALASLLVKVRASRAVTS